MNIDNLLQHHVIICSPLFGHDNGPLARSSTSPRYVLVDPRNPTGLSDTTLQEAFQSLSYKDYQFMVLERYNEGTKDEYLRAHPIHDDEVLRGMASGNYLNSSDSRFRRLINRYPVPVHDRFEK